MDERVHEHAEVLVDWSARIEAGDDVVVSVAEDAHDLGVAVVEGARRAGRERHDTVRVGGDLAGVFKRE